MYDALKAALGPGEKPETKPAETKPPAAETKPPVGETKDRKYETPADLNPKGQQRFKELVSELRTKDELVGQLQERVKSADGFLEAAKGVGAGPQEMGQFFEFMGYLNGGRPQDAIKVLENQISLIAKEFGLAAGGNENDLLSRHTDLKEEVETYRMTRERALELAQAREQDHRRRVADETRTAAQDRAAMARKSEDDAIAEITKWADSIRGSDIDWARKKPVLFEQLAAIVDGVPPEKWLAKIQAAYGLMGKVQAPPPAPGQARGRQPLRASTGSGAPQAGSMFEAIKQGLTPG